MKNKTRNMMLGGLAVIIAIMGWRMAGAEEDEAAVAQNSVNQTRAKYANDCDEYNRYQILFDRGAYSRQQLETARTKMLASQADYDSAQANLSSAEKQVAEATVVSPVDGLSENGGFGCYYDRYVSR